ncbi:hypothetical protein ACJIZ3_006102 [Penstemon smallii]|uniref:Bromo domain-containing protein n=1 Tax=Penstemon smallii TaxID=265156 RepID=A0ABD3S6W1_9LAMI
MVTEDQSRNQVYSSIQHLRLPNMTPENSILRRKLKFKITTKGILNISEEKSCEHVAEVSSKKRRPESLHDGQRVKIRKMDRNVKLQCGNILKELMGHPYGYIFSEPVDPVKLNIPDYFSIISDPMDLGTIKNKLERNMYFRVEEFASDVRLTFSNAMTYNPPEGDVHKIAKFLNVNFSMKWKSLESKLNRERSNVSGSNDQVSKKITQKVTMPSEEKENLKSVLVEVLSRRMTEKVHTVFQKFGLTGLKGKRLQSYIDSIDDETLWKLRKELKGYFDARAGKVEPMIMEKKRSLLTEKPVQKGADKFSRSCGAFAPHKQSFDSTADKCCSCGSLKCHCQFKNASAQASSEISSGRSSEHGPCGDSKLNFELKYPLTSNTNPLGPDSDGPGVVVNEESISNLSTPDTTSNEGWTCFNVQMSPKKALRAAMLKRRFAATIYKATHQGEDSNPGRIDLERERLERIQKEIKAAEVAIQTELKMQREREREAARMSLLKMEKTVDFDENLRILKELEMMCCISPSNLSDCENPLAQLGLFIKDDYLEEEEEDAMFNGEDGEILL